MCEPLDRLQHRLPGAAEERDALVHLGGLRRVLEQHDVGERVARSEHGHALGARRLGDLVAELVDLGDRLLEVALGDVVGGDGHGVATVFGVRSASSYRARRLRPPLARLRDPLQALEVEQRLRPAEDLGASAG